MRKLLLVTLAALTLGMSGCGGGSIESDVAATAGGDVECSEVGLMLVAGERETVFECENADTFENAGCFARVDGDLYDVSEQARVVSDVDC